MTATTVDDDAIALRGFGGACGAEGNTTQLVDFGDVFDPTAADLNEAVRAIVDGRLDVADRTIDDVAPITADAEFENLRSRARTPAAVDLHAKTAQLRDRQGRVIEAARQLLDAARSGTPFGERFEAFQRAAEDYNSQVDAVDEVLAALRATSPGVTR